MRKYILTCLCNVILLMALCLPAEARITIGITPSTPFSSVDQTSLDQMAKALGNAAGTSVKIRRFEDNAAITNWLLRFQEIDAAIVAADFIKQHPAGTLKHLVDIHLKETSAPLILVVRSNQNSNQIKQIKKAFLELGSQKNGRQTLNKLKLTGITQPGETFKPAPPPAQPTTQPAVTKQVNGQKSQKTPQTEQVEPKPTPPVPAAALSAVANPNPGLGKVESPTIKPPTEQEAKSPAITVSKALKPANTVEDKSLPESRGQNIAKQEPLAKPIPGQKQVEAERSEVKPPPSKRLVIFISLIILAAISLKTCLIALRWRKSKRTAQKTDEIPAMDTAFPTGGTALQNKHSEAAIDAIEEQVIEEGRLGPGQVPQLLQRCANLSKPVVLHVSKGSSKKLVYFAAGQVSGALTQHLTKEDSQARWNKLGNLLVREEMITAEECDQGVALLTNEPGLRLGEALLKLGLIDLAGLRHALTRQAKVTIYSLILYPEGHYKVFADDGSLPPEESVSLEVSTLIREASQHQSEWTAIRKTLPSLNTALKFCPDGRSKLENVRLSPQQEATLSLVDGSRTINELCIESAMMDYEIYRFLYLMAKAGVLK